MTLFAVIYGSKFDNIIYFSDVNKARNTLILLTVNNLKKRNYDEYILLYQYIEKNGKYIKSDVEYFIEFDKLENFCFDNNYLLNDIYDYPELVYHLVETC